MLSIWLAHLISLILAPHRYRDRAKERREEKNVDYEAGEEDMEEV